MKKILLLVILYSSIAATAQTPDSLSTQQNLIRPYVQIGLNKDIGLGYYEGPSYHNGAGVISTLFSPGGGMGLALGGGLRLNGRFNVGLQANWQGVLAGGSYSSTQGSNSSAWNKMGRLSLSPRVDLLLLDNPDFFRDVVKEVRLGAGPTYNVYSKLVQKGNEGGQELAYRNSWGWTLQASFLMDYFNREDIIAVGNIGYRNSQLRAVDPDAPEEYQAMNGSGLHFQFGIRKYLN